MSNQNFIWILLFFTYFLKWDIFDLNYSQFVKEVIININSNFTSFKHFAKFDLSLKSFYLVKDNYKLILWGSKL